MSILFLGVSQNMHKPQFTPKFTGLLENTASSWYRYFFDRVYKMNSASEHQYKNIKNDGLFLESMHFGKVS